MRWTVVAVMCIMQLLYNGNVSLVHNASNNISRIDVKRKRRCGELHKSSNKFIPDIIRCNEQTYSTLQKHFWVVDYVA